MSGLWIPSITYGGSEKEKELAIGVIALSFVPRRFRFSTVGTYCFVFCLLIAVGSQQGFSSSEPGVSRAGVSTGRAAVDCVNGFRVVSLFGSLPRRDALSVFCNIVFCWSLGSLSVVHIGLRPFVCLVLGIS